MRQPLDYEDDPPLRLADFQPKPRASWRLNGWVAAAIFAVCLVLWTGFVLIAGPFAIAVWSAIP